MGGPNGGQVAQAAVAGAQGLGIQMQIDYTRQIEQEADRLGFQRLEAAGFDVTAMATFMERLQRASRFAEGNAPSYLRDHPVTYERIAEAQARAQGKPFKQVKDSLDFNMVRALVRSYQGTTKEAIAFFEDALAEKRYNDPIAARYGLIASLLRAQDFKRAQAELLILEKATPPHPMIDAMAGQVLMQSGQLTAAIARYQAALARYPNKQQLIYDYPEALLKDKQAAKASTYLSEQLLRYPNDGPLHLLAAKAFAALGKQTLAHQHQAEYYAWLGNLPGAVVQFELAVKAGDGDFYQASVAESRLREMRQELADQKKRIADGRSG
jgi:predicted Zn-dependent protease